MPTDEDYLWVSFVRWRVCAMKRLESDRPGWSLSQGVDRGSMREQQAIEHGAHGETSCWQGVPKPPNVVAACRCLPYEPFISRDQRESNRSCGRDVAGRCRTQIYCVSARFRGHLPP